MNQPRYLGHLSHYHVTNPRTFIVQTVDPSFDRLSQLNPLAFDELLWNKVKVYYVIGHDPKNPVVNDTDEPCVLKHVHVDQTLSLPPGGEIVFATLWKSSTRYPFIDEEQVLDFVCTTEAKREFQHTPSNYIPGSAIFPDDYIKYYTKKIPADKVRYRNLTSKDISIYIIEEVKSTDFLPNPAAQDPYGV